jgi:hypothetical protein
MSEPKQKSRVFSIKEANAFFILLAFLFLTVGSYVQSRELISGLLITEFGLLALPVILYAIFTKKDLKKVFRLKRLPFEAVLKIIVLAALLIPIIAVANLVTIFFIELFGKPIVSMIPTATNTAEYLLLFAVIAGSAGICEEIFFRGVILNGYESEVGLKWGAIFSGILFGIFHFNPQNFFGPIILGIVFSYLVQLTGSILAGIVAHMANNGIAVTMGYLLNVFDGGSGNVATGDVAFESIGIMLGVMAFYCIVAFIFFIGIKSIFRSLNKMFPRTMVVSTYDEALNEMILVKVSDDGPLWKPDRLKMSVGHYFPISLSVVLYGLIIYLAYF